MAATPLPPSPDAVYLVSERGYRSGSSYYLFVEVINGRSEQVCDVGAVARFYDKDGVLVAVESGYAMLNALFPQQKAPIQMIILSAPSSLARYTLELSWSNRCYSKYRNVSVLSQSARETGFGVEVFGEVRNDHPETMQFVRSVVTFYDAGGRIWHADYTYLEGDTNLASGRVGVYNISTYEDGLASLPYTVQAQGRAVNNAQ